MMWEPSEEDMEDYLDMEKDILQQQSSVQEDEEAFLHYLEEENENQAATAPLPVSPAPPPPPSAATSAATSLSAQGSSYRREGAPLTSSAQLALNRCDDAGSAALAK